MATKPLGSAHATLMPSAKEQYHAVRSINQHGEIQHAHALAQVYLRNGNAETQAQAVEMAAAEIAHIRRIAEGDSSNRTARMLLDEQERALKSQQGLVAARPLLA